MLLKLYDKNNNPQDLQRIIDILNDGGLIIYPTDTMYAWFEGTCHRKDMPDQRDRPSKEQPVYHLL